MRKEEHMTHMGKKRDVYRILVKKREELTTWKTQA
jgi:hypothetical protein